MPSRHRPHRHRIDPAKVAESIRWHVREAALANTATAAGGATAGTTGAAARERARSRIQLPRRGHGGRQPRPWVGR
eukprot:12758892-Alexandrium_andersonii.AAC.1